MSDSTRPKPASSPPFTPTSVAFPSREDIGTYSMFEWGIIVMGDEFTTAELPPLQIRIIGTGPVAEVEVIRNEKIIYTAAPDRQDVTLTFRDQEPTAGTSYYYVRMVQENPQVAWGSPIWVNLQPSP